MNQYGRHRPFGGTRYSSSRQSGNRVCGLGVNVSGYPRDGPRDPPLFGAGARFLIAGAVLSGWVAATRGIAGLDLSRRQWVNAAATGLLILVGGIGSVTVAEQNVPSGLTALLIASIPLWVILLRLAKAEDIARRTIGSVTVGFVGLGFLLLPRGRAEGVDWGRPFW